MFGTFVLIPTILELPSALGYGFGKTVTEAGLYLLPTVIAMIIFAPLAGILIRRVGPKPPMLFGGLAVTAAFIIPAIDHSQLWEIVASGILTGAGIGLALASLSNAVIESVPATQTGEAISANTIARTIGSSIGTAVIAAIISSNSAVLRGQAIPLDKGFTIGFWACFGVAVLAILGAIVSPSMRKRHEQALALGVSDFPEETHTGRTAVVTPETQAPLQP
jgi:MFS family permease